MARRAADLLKAALELDAAGRAELAAELIASLDREPDEEAAPAWAAEVRARAARALGRGSRRALAGGPQPARARSPEPLIAALRVGREASAEIAAASRWYERERPCLGRAFLRMLDRAISRIEVAPHSGAPVLGVADVGIRRIPARRFP